jgi:hypothetical protein
MSSKGIPRVTYSHFILKILEPEKQAWMKSSWPKIRSARFSKITKFARRKSADASRPALESGPEHDPDRAENQAVNGHAGEEPNHSKEDVARRLPGVRGEELTEGKPGTEQDVQNPRRGPLKEDGQGERGGTDAPRDEGTM